jgi:hypothetical protein
MKTNSSLIINLRQINIQSVSCNLINQMDCVVFMHEWAERNIQYGKEEGKKIVLIKPQKKRWREKKIIDNEFLLHNYSLSENITICYTQSLMWYGRQWICQGFSVSRSFSTHFLQANRPLAFWNGLLDRISSCVLFMNYWWRKDIWTNMFSLQWLSIRTRKMKNPKKKRMRSLSTRTVWLIEVP